MATPRTSISASGRRSLARAHAACRAAREANLRSKSPLRRPGSTSTKRNMSSSGRSRLRIPFNTGRLMRISTAARLWDKLEPDGAQYERFQASWNDSGRL